MKKFLSLPLSIILLSFCIAASAAVKSGSGGVHLVAAGNNKTAFEERREAVASMMEAATVWIVADDDKNTLSGTGFIVGDGYIATNGHVVAGLRKGGSVYVLNELIPARKASVIALVHNAEAESGVGERDFALLRFEPPKGVALPVPVLNFTIKRMDRVSAWGYPTMATKFDVSTERLHKGDVSALTAPPVIYTEGTVNAIVHARAGDAVLHSAQIAAGNSGGPLVNGRGEIVGVNTWGYREDDEGAFLNGAQLSLELAWFLAENGVKPKLSAGQALGERPPKRAAEDQRAAKPAVTPPEDRRRDLGSFTVRVPLGWSVIDEEKDAIILGSDDRAASMALALLSNEGKSLHQIARQLSKSCSGTEPEADDDMYVFTSSDRGVDGVYVVTDSGDGRHFIMLSIFGDSEKAGIEEILDSVEDK